MKPPKSNAQSAWPADKVERRAVADLIPYARNARTHSDAQVAQIAKPAKSETGHSTQKPVECMKRPIENNSSPGQAVYEPFSGSGTTIIAGEMTGRCVYAMELNPPYVDVAIKRWQDFTGQKATLESDGRTFEDVVASRYDWKQDAVGSYDTAIAAKREELTHARA